ncbi:MAG: NADH-quinone oxidoreductase subunit NuoE [Ignavibacteria bacterium]|nr:NADH-quinone oxidoreductase subunit NuoE [Ignavibacteria bacterium]
MRVKRVNSLKKEKSADICPDLKPLENLIKKYKDKKGNLIPLLQGTQNLLGYIPDEAFIMISKETGLKINEMYGVATFYAQFRLKPVGKHIIKICHGTACHVQNANKVTEDLVDFLKVKDGETTPDGIFTLESVACLGCCSLAPVMMISDETYGKLTGKKAVEVIKEIKRKESLAQKSKPAESVLKN